MDQLLRRHPHPLSGRRQKLSIVYGSEWVQNYEESDGFQKYEHFDEKALKSKKLESLVRSRFGDRAWEELLFAADNIVDEPTQFVDPATHKLGMKNHQGTGVLPALYDYLWDFQDGLCMISQVIDRDRRGLVDIAGNIIVPPVFNTLGPVVKNRILFQREFEGPYGYFDRQGKIVIEATFQQAADFMSDSRARVTSPAGVKGTIDTNGRFREEA